MRLGGAVAQRLPQGVADNSGHVFAQTPDAFLDPIEAAVSSVEPAVDLLEPAVDLLEPLLRLRLKRKQVPVNATNLLDKEPERGALQSR